MTRRNLKWSLSLLSLSVVMPAISFPSYADETSSPHRPLPKSLEKEHARPTPVPLKKRQTTSVISGNEAISVSGKRVRNHGAEVAVTRTIMERFIPGTNPMQVLSQSLPGANFTSSDAFGLDTAANTFYVRGFTQTQIGATLDGIPLGTQGFTNQNGVSITQAMIQDDLAGMTLSQGAGSLDTFSAQLLGAAMSYVSSDPTDKAGGRLSQSFGSYNAFRTYARADSGVLNPSGTKFYASFARTESNLWKGEGYQRELQADAKLVQPVGPHGKLTGFFGFGNFTQANYLSLTKTCGSAWVGIQPISSPTTKKPSSGLLRAIYLRRPSRL